MQGVKAMRFVVVSSFVVTYVDGDRCVESREYMMRPCSQDRETERRRGKSIVGEGKKKISKKLQKKGGKKGKTFKADHSTVK